ncbi:MAG: MotA/TolQ/ExbB proton channel family protein [Rhodanobacteraceae bacterium]|nr:MotA/TolQ/ExbB proton channel family protein [Rhodanobacteraceae bacterium]HPF74197.1 MotA/TolQ/ExbB proton channel family protein [Xanthomonadaceae bacterium]HRY01108.1 MotA/TolQ/ExbB proton channel family protein [Xanthomonadaceae bacterium]
MISGAQQGWIEALQGYLGSGGLVMPVLVLVTIVLWYAIGCRWALLNRGSRKNVRVMIKRREDGRSKSLKGIVDMAVARGVTLARQQPEALRRRLDDAFGEFDADLRRYATTVTAMVAIAPLLGLLGTVAGMIETFRSLGDMTMFSQSGGIASGIATALFTTQMGLVVAVPGVIAKAFLDRRETQIAHDLEQIKDILVSGVEPQES